MSDAKTVTVYSAPWCGFCHAVKQYLDGKKVVYKDVNIDEDRDAAEYVVNKTGQAGIPVVMIGNDTIIGFDRPKIDIALRDAKLV